MPDSLLVPDHTATKEDLPADVWSALTQYQREGLALGFRDFKVAAARVQTFQTGSNTFGVIAGGGLDRSIGENWVAFGGIGAVNQSTMNKFKTDIQLKVEDYATGGKDFLATTLPFELTLSIDSGDRVRLFFVRGGLARPYGSDFRIEEWTVFLAQNFDTGQVFPVSPLPSFAIPKRRLTGGFRKFLVLATVATVLLIHAAVKDEEMGAIVLVAIVLLFVFYLRGYYAYDDDKSALASWNHDFELAKKFAAENSTFANNE